LAEIRLCAAEGYCGPRPPTAPLPEHRIHLAVLIGEVKADPVLAATILRQAHIQGGAASGMANIQTACASLGEEQVLPDMNRVAPFLPMFVTATV
jgi:hypothetical protein